MDPTQITWFTNRLTERRDEWQHRLAAIRRDRRRENGPLDPDFAEQATQRENDEALDALDARGRRALSDIDGALDSIEKGSFGTCRGCGDEIESARLEVEPTAPTCTACAGANPS